MYCPKCYKMNDDSNLRCVNCGYDLHKKSPEIPGLISKKILIPAIAAALLLFLLFGRLFSGFNIRVHQNGNSFTIRSSKLIKMADKEETRFTNEYILQDTQLSFTAKIKHISIPSAQIYGSKYKGWRSYVFDNGIEVFTPLTHFEKGDKVSVTGDVIAKYESIFGDDVAVYVEASYIG